MPADDGGASNPEGGPGGPGDEVVPGGPDDQGGFDRPDGPPAERNDMGGRQGEGNKGMSEDMMMGTMEAQVAFLGMALGNAATLGLNLFRYRAAGLTTYYDNGTTAWSGGTNWWKLASQTMAYVNLAVWGVAALTQLLATFGIMTDINLLVWMYGVFLVGMISTAITGLLYGYAFDSAWTNYYDLTLSTAVRNASGTVFSAVWSEMLEFSI